MPVVGNRVARPPGDANNPVVADLKGDPRFPGFGLQRTLYGVTAAAHSRFLRAPKSFSTALCEVRGPAAYGSGESLPGADVLQAASSNSRVLYTLDVKSCIIAFDKSTLLLRAIGQLKSHA